MATVEAPTQPQIRLHQGPFANETLTDFSNEENARKMRAAIDKVRGQLGREYELIIGGKRIKTQDKIKSLNPAKPSQVVGVHQKAGKEHVEPAMQAALGAFEQFEQTLLHPFPAHISGNTWIVTLSGNLIDFIYINNSLLGRIYVKIAYLQQPAQNAFHVFAYVTRLGKDGGIHDGKWHV